jgi:hypothetical protein
MLFELRREKIVLDKGVRCLYTISESAPKITADLNKTTPSPAVLNGFLNRYAENAPA